jgi:hypothetical protein
MPNYVNSTHVPISQLSRAPLYGVRHHYEGPEHLNGLGGTVADIWNILTGKPQSWYTMVSTIQNRLSVALAGVTAVGPDVWNFVSQSAQGPSASSTPASGVDPYETVIPAINAALAGIIVTQDKVPSDADVSAAQATAGTYENQLAYVQSVAPEVSAQVQADQTQVQAMLPGPMQSPAAVGQATFLQELSDRANALLGGLSIVTMALLGIGGIAAYLYYFGGRR